MKFFLFSFFAFVISYGFSQTVTLPYDFETGVTWTDFDGGVGTNIPNPVSGGINTSSNVGRIVRNGGQIWAGTYITTSANLSFGTNPYICFKYYTTAPAGTPFRIKMDGSADVLGTTSVSGAWDDICFDMTGQCTCNRIVFLFDFGTIGNGSANSTVYIDDIQQLSEPILPFTTNSEYFCDTPGETVTFTIGSACDWYDDETGGSILSGGTATSTFTTGVLTAQEDYWYDCGGTTPIARQDVGPTTKGSSNFVTTASTFFTNNLDNGNWYSADFVQKIVGGGPPPYNCTYTVTALNLTQTTNRVVVLNDAASTDNKQVAANFPTALPMDAGDLMELRVAASGDVGCFASSHHSGGDVITSFPTSTAGGELTFTSHTAVANNWTGFDFNVEGDLPAPRVNVNAIVNCAAGCDLSNSGLLSVNCNDNSTTPNAADDYITFDLNPTGSGLGATYSVSVSSGTITPNTGISYGSATSFQLQGGSAGAGDITLTITDVDDGACTLDTVITDPGSCSVITNDTLYFCDSIPGESVTFVIGSACDWYDDEFGGSVLTGGSSTASFTTPLLTAAEDYWYQCGASTPVARQDVGPTSKGSSDPMTSVSTFFTSNLNNGNWYSVDIVEKIIGGAPPYNCTYTVTGLNLTQGTSRVAVINDPTSADNRQIAATFPTPLPMFVGDNMELRVSVTGSVGCLASSHHSGGDVITSYPTTTAGGELTFTSHTAIANHWTGFDFNVDGEFSSPRTRVDALVSCDATCLTPIHDTLCLSPASSATLAITESGNNAYNWYADSTGGSILSGGSDTNSYTTPPISVTTNYWVEDAGILANTFVTGPVTEAVTPIDVGTFVDTRFTPDSNGTLNSITMTQGATGAGANCEFEILLWDWTDWWANSNAASATIDRFVHNTGTNVDNTQSTVNFTFGTLIAGHDYVLRIREGGWASTPAGCQAQSHTTGDGPGAVAATYPGINFTSHCDPGSEACPNDGNWTGYDWNITQNASDGACTSSPRTKVVAVSGSCPMSIDLLKFNIEDKEGAAHLKWNLLADQDIQNFKVLRSSNGINFKPIGNINAQLQKNSYSFTDQHPLEGISYYQITVIGKQNSLTSETLKFTTGGLSHVKVYPNPAKNELTIENAFDRKSNLKIRILDIMGREHYVSNQPVEAGLFNKQIGIKNINAGIYIVELSTQYETKYIKINKY